MPKDYKDSPSTRSSSDRVNHPLLLGMIIGVLLGIVISLAVALWLNRLSNPFVEKGKVVEPTPKMAPVQPPPPADAAKKVEQAAQGKAPEKGAKNERPRFEFYQILPGEKEAAPEKPAAQEKPAPSVASKAPAPAAAPAKPGSSPAAPKPHSGETFWLQAGAFSEEREADNLKARIALTGLEASVKPVKVPDRGTLYRVRLGPYQSIDDANRMKTVLSQNGVAAAIIRTTDEAKNP
ncbi:MAG: SPOR domain-containing protein [Betaproteobacteria bacterium]